MYSIVSYLEYKNYNSENSCHIFWASLVAQMVKNLPAVQETGVQSVGQEDPLEKGMVFLPGESHGKRSLAGCGSWDYRVGHD